VTQISAARPRRRPRIHWLFLLFLSIIIYTQAFHRAPCKKIAVKYQFQFSECYAPNINQDLYLSEASFVMAHDAATGYLVTKNKKNKGDSYSSNAISDSVEYGDESWELQDDAAAENWEEDHDDAMNYHDYQGSTWDTFSTNLLAVYGKTQVGSVYQQLNDGARALDLRPRIYNNGTVGFHHGSLINIPLTTITLAGLLEDAKQWCNDNPKELVIIFHHELTHEAGYNALSSEVYTEIDDFYVTGDDGVVYDEDENDSQDNDDDQTSYSYFYSGIAKLKGVYREQGVPYYPCEKLSGITVGEAMQLADLSKLGGKGYLLAVDRHDMYGSFCGKANWISDELVTCHSKNDDREGNSQRYQMCTDRKNTGKLSALRDYVLQSSNNDATDDADELGPPADEYYYPFNQIQGFWQVDSTSVKIGVKHAASTLLDDNRRSNVNAEMVQLAYNQQFKKINLFSMDNVALNGNAMFSVLRNGCGQSVIKDDDEYFTCGKNLVMPHMNVSQRLPIFWNIILIVVYSSLFIMVSVMLIQAFGLREHGLQDHRLECNGVLI